MVEPHAEPMNPDRFAELADAFGGRISMWPEECRDAAHAFAETERGQAILARHGFDPVGLAAP